MRVLISFLNSVHSEVVWNQFLAEYLKKCRKYLKNSEFRMFQDFSGTRENNLMLKSFLLRAHF